MSGGDFDIKALRIDPAKFAAPPIPAKIRKRREQFVMMPMWWYEKLSKPVAAGTTFVVALHLLHLDWKQHAKPFKLPNGMLEYDGISRHSKLRALSDLERRGMIIVERRSNKSPIIRVLVVQS